MVNGYPKRGMAAGAHQPYMMLTDAWHRIFEFWRLLSLRQRTPWKVTAQQTKGNR